MSYPPQQWQGAGVISPNPTIQAQGELLQSTNVFGTVPGNPHRPPIHPMPVHLGQVPYAAQNTAPSFCPPGPQPIYQFYPQFLSAGFPIPTQPGQARPNAAFAIPHPSAPQSHTAAATAYRGSALLSQPAFQAAGAGPSTAAPQQLHQLNFFPPLNGLPFGSTFPAAPNLPHFQNPHHSNSNSHPQQQQQPSGPYMPPPQVRGYDSLRHFGALPQVTGAKKNKSTTTSKTNLYITGLSESDTDETVRALVENVVQPKSCKAMIVNGKCRGSGFIDCATEEDAITAMNHLTEMSRNGGRQLTVKYALENEKDLHNVYVRNLPKHNFTKDNLSSLFEEFGQVTSVKLLESGGVGTGIGFVRFSNADDALRAVNVMNERQYVWPGSGDSGLNNGAANGNGEEAKPITCKLADKADPKRRAAAAAAAAAVATSAGGVPHSTSGSNNNNATSRTSNSRSHAGAANPRHMHYGLQHHSLQQQPQQQQQQAGDVHLNSRLQPSAISALPTAAAAAAAAATAGGAPMVYPQHPGIQLDGSEYVYAMATGAQAPSAPGGFVAAMPPSAVAANGASASGAPMPSPAGQASPTGIANHQQQQQAVNGHAGEQLTQPSAYMAAYAAMYQRAAAQQAASAGVDMTAEQLRLMTLNATAASAVAAAAAANGNVAASFYLPEWQQAHQQQPTQNHHPDMQQQQQSAAVYPVNAAYHLMAYQQAQLQQHQQQQQSLPQQSQEVSAVSASVQDEGAKDVSKQCPAPEGKDGRSAECTHKTEVEDEQQQQLTQEESDQPSAVDQETSSSPETAAVVAAESA